ncbi:MAG: hypothetical protein COY41_01180, partial [Candidatus Altarchaeum sp. CG_4_10_14_0_8_um_filter_32_851]
FEDESKGGKLVLSPNFVCVKNLDYYKEEVEKIRKNLNLENKSVLLFVGFGEKKLQKFKIKKNYKKFTFS